MTYLGGGGSLEMSISHSSVSVVYVGEKMASFQVHLFALGFVLDDEFLFPLGLLLLLLPFFGELGRVSVHLHLPLQLVRTGLTPSENHQQMIAHTSRFDLFNQVFKSLHVSLL